MDINFIYVNIKLSVATKGFSVLNSSLFFYLLSENARRDIYDTVLFLSASFVCLRK